MENSFILKMVNVFTKMFFYYFSVGPFCHFFEEQNKYLKKKTIFCTEKKQHYFKLKEFSI